jgi:hypothetical protein
LKALDLGIPKTLDASKFTLYQTKYEERLKILNKRKSH